MLQAARWRIIDILAHNGPFQNAAHDLFSVVYNVEITSAAL